METKTEIDTQLILTEVARLIHKELPNKVFLRTQSPKEQLQVIAEIPSEAFRLPIDDFSSKYLVPVSKHLASKLENMSACAECELPHYEAVEFADRLRDYDTGLVVAVMRRFVFERMSWWTAFSVLAS